jgi:hypothetical protein
MIIYSLFFPIFNSLFILYLKQLRLRLLHLLDRVDYHHNHDCHHQNYAPYDVGVKFLTIYLD